MYSVKRERIHHCAKYSPIANPTSSYGLQTSPLCPPSLSRATSTASSRGMSDEAEEETEITRDYDTDYQREYREEEEERATMHSKAYKYQENSNGE